MISNKDRLIVALDVPDRAAALAAVDQLGDSVSFYKVGLELFMSGEYFELIEDLAARDCRIFADLKFFDIPNTVASAVRQLDKLPVDFCTVHGNDRMMAAAAEAATRTQVLAVTALTSLDRGDLDDLGFQCDVADLVVSRARRALASGCAGVVASGQEAQMLREAVGDKLLLVCPGIRPVVNDDDQKRSVDVATAFANGADYIVMGRPILGATDPRRAAMAVQAIIAEVT